MNEFPAPEIMAPARFYPMLVLMTPGIGLVLTVLGGWTGLAKTFRAKQAVKGERFRFVSGATGSQRMPVRYKNCLTVTANETRFGFAIWLPMRLAVGPRRPISEACEATVRQANRQPDG